MNSKKSVSQKSTISIVIISVITGGIIALYQHFNQSNMAEQDFTYQAADQHKLALIKTIPLTDREDLAVSAPSDFIIAEPLDQRQLPSNESVLFTVASDEIEPVYFAALSAIAEEIKMIEKGKQTVWQIVGHADRSGTLKFNLKLAQQRAQAVGNFLLDQGVKQEQISILSLGESSPVKSTQSHAVNGLDRRVEIHHYQAEIAALAKQLNRQMNSTVEQQKSEPLQTEPSVIAATGFGFKQNQTLALRAAVIRF